MSFSSIGAVYNRTFFSKRQKGSREGERVSVYVCVCVLVSVSECECVRVRERQRERTRESGLLKKTKNSASRLPPLSQLLFLPLSLPTLPLSHPHLLSLSLSLSSYLSAHLWSKSAVLWSMHGRLKTLLRATLNLLFNQLPLYQLFTLDRIFTSKVKTWSEKQTNPSSHEISLTQWLPVTFINSSLPPE